jgi:hypothetical protein
MLTIKVVSLGDERVCLIVRKAVRDGFVSVLDGLVVVPDLVVDLRDRLDARRHFRLLEQSIVELRLEGPLSFTTWAGTYDTLGRYLYAHVSVKF